MVRRDLEDDEDKQEAKQESKQEIKQSPEVIIREVCIPQETMLNLINQKLDYIISIIKK